MDFTASIPRYFKEPLLKIPTKRRRVIGSETEILVHVEPDHSGPVDPLIGNERGEELVLTWSGGEDDVRSTRLRLPFGDGNRDRFSGTSTHPRPIFVNYDPE